MITSSLLSIANTFDQNEINPTEEILPLVNDQTNIQVNTDTTLTQTPTDEPITISVDALERNLNHIKEQKLVVLAELRKTLVVGRKAKFAAKQDLKDAFPALKTKIKNTIDLIVHSEEFSDALTSTTDYQKECICEKNMTFDQITYEKNEAISNKISLELHQAFPQLDEKTNTLFNIFYITYANSNGCKLLIDKLDKEIGTIRKQINSLKK